MKRLAIIFFVLLFCTSIAFARKWTDSTGQYTTEAEFVDLKDGKVQLKKEGGKIIYVPIEKLSDSDQKYVYKLLSKKLKIDESNPKEQDYDTELTYFVVKNDIDKYIGKRVGWLGKQVTYESKTDFTGNKIKSAYTYIIVDKNGKGVADNAFVYENLGSNQDMKQTLAAKEAENNSRDEGIRLIVGTIVGSTDIHTQSVHTLETKTKKVPLLKDILIDVPKGK
ncbi:MAG: SHD1 domain-containing protein [Thermoguttaceae bacterium]|jgi:hypothetical protein